MRAKFKVTESRRVDAPSSYHCEFVLKPVVGPGNESWSKWTPSGELKITVTNPAAAAELEVGGTYYLDFIRVEEERPKQAVDLLGPAGSPNFDSYQTPRGTVEK